MALWFLPAQLKRSLFSLRIFFLSFVLEIFWQSEDLWSPSHYTHPLIMVVLSLEWRTLARLGLYSDFSPRVLIKPLPVCLSVCLSLSLSLSVCLSLSLSGLFSYDLSVLYRIFLSPLLQSFHQFYIGPLLPVIIISYKFRPNSRQFVQSMSDKPVIL